MPGSCRKAYKLRGMGRTGKQLAIGVVVLVAAVVSALGGQAADPRDDSGSRDQASSYRLRLPVDEVILSFHAADARGLPVNDLKLEELSLLDNGHVPRRVLSFLRLQDAPLRVGILMDTSQSMVKRTPPARAIAVAFAQKMLRVLTDRAFVMDFGELSTMAQPWTGDANALIAGISNQSVADQASGRRGGTAMLDSIYRACLNQFGHIDNQASGNFILLFSDGEDNLSHAELKDAVDECQRSQTVIYAFRAESELSGGSGPRTLAELVAETGGRVFRDDETEAQVDEDLRTIEGEMRDEYRLVYKPYELRHDGSFHRIELSGPERASKLVVRSGYYAPVR